MHVPRTLLTWYIDHSYAHVHDELSIEIYTYTSCWVYYFSFFLFLIFCSENTIHVKQSSRTKLHVSSLENKIWVTLMLEHSICTHYIYTIYPNTWCHPKFVCYLSRQWKGLICLYAPLMFKTRNHIDILKQSIAYTCTFGGKNITMSPVIPSRPKLFWQKYK